MLQYEPKLLQMILIVRFFILFFLNQFLTDVELEEPGKCYNMNQGVRGVHQNWYLFPTTVLSAARNASRGLVRSAKCYQGQRTTASVAMSTMVAMTARR